MTDSDGPIIPATWKPTLNEPVPVIRCTAIKRDGDRCKRWSLRGTNVCVKHGGQLPTVQEHAAAVVEAARLRIINMTDQAVDVLQDLMVNAAAEKIRLDAARDVLDRAGVKGALEIDLTVSQGESAADRARRMLEDTATRMAEKIQDQQERDADNVVDGELVEDE